jgi:hypothetical protein
VQPRALKGTSHTYWYEEVQETGYQPKVFRAAMLE